MSEFKSYIGLDTHKATIAVAVARAGREAPQFTGTIANTKAAVTKFLKEVEARGEPVSFCYEAGPCGYELYRTILAHGHACVVVAPSLIPRKPGDQLKTDRRDALMLARLHRAGELTSVWVPDPEQESMRDLTRAREDMKELLTRAQQRLGAFLLRHNQVYREGKSHWTQAHWRWLERVKMGSPVQQIVLQEYIDTVRTGQCRVAGLEHEMALALEHWSQREVVVALQAMRGVQLVAAMTIVAELGELTRFGSPRELMAFLGLVPSEHSSGAHRTQGHITRTGNGHVRRVLVEAAWAYQYPARKTRQIEQRAERCSAPVQAIAWQAQKRLCARYRALLLTGKVKNKVTTAIAREMAGFIWAIACEVGGRPHASRAVV